MNAFLLSLPIFIISHFASCTKLVEVNAPITSFNAQNAYSTDAAAIAVLTSIYTKMSSMNFDFATGKKSISVLAGLSADEYTLYRG